MIIENLCFDMDGTIADLYGVPNWLEQLQNESATPYEVAEPLVDMRKLLEILNGFRAKGVAIRVITWSAKDATAEYNAEIRTAKIEWLEKHGFQYDSFHLVKYGTTKRSVVRRYINNGLSVLIDDNEKVRSGWSAGLTIDANNDFLDDLDILLSQL